MITFIFITSGIAILFCFYIIFKPKSAEQKEYEKKLQESLDDEYIIDPETGKKLELVQTESGDWIPVETDMYQTSSSELTKEAEMAEECIKYLNEHKDFQKLIDLHEKDIQMLDNSIMLNNYENWSYSNPFEYSKGKVILPAPEIYGSTYYQDDYSESQLMFWIKINNINGHYYFRSKSKTEKILDKLRKDDDIRTKNYECFTLKKSFNPIEIERLLKLFADKSNFEVEINNDLLLAKTDRLININDVENMIMLIKNIG